MNTREVFEIAEILVAHAVRTHGAEVAIVAYYGSHAKGTATATSDLDLFYIPDAGKAAGLSSQFILDGLPYDFWPLEWDVAEQIANAAPGRPWAVAASLIADAHLLYARSPEDRVRFAALKARVFERTAPAAYPYMVARSLEEFKSTLFRLAQLRLAVAAGEQSARLAAAWEFVNSVLNCLALLNQTWFAKGWGANLDELAKLAQRPDGLEELIQAAVLGRSGDEQLAAAERLARALRQLLLVAQASTGTATTAAEAFKDFYPIAFELAQKVRRACASGDEMAAGYAAYLLQHEISMLLNKVEIGFDAMEFNVLDEYGQGYQAAGFPDLLEPAAQGDLDELARRVQALEGQLAKWLTVQGIDLNILADNDALRAFLTARVT